VTVDPRDRKSWQGFLDLLRPPPGYRVVAALGTTFGLSFDALTAALLAMLGTDGEELARDPVAGVIAITRLRASVRVLVHPGTISNPIQAMPKRLIGLLDRFIADVKPKSGLFHPKVWALRFRRIEASASSGTDEKGRVFVCSRNLTGSRSFELSAAFEGPAGIDAAVTPFARDVAGAIQAWLDASSRPAPDAISELPAFVRRLSFDVPHEARDRMRFHWQGLGRAPLDNQLRSQCDRVVVVAPFVRRDFVSTMLARTRELRIVSTSECLDELDDLTFDNIEERGRDQGTPVLYQVDEHGDPEDACIEGIHAKLVMTESPTDSVTLVGSANATGPGWGFAGPANVEAMAELRPGITIKAFVKAFLFESKDKPHPWVSVYDRSARTEPDPTRELERRLLGALRDVGMLELTLRYDETQRRLSLSRKLQTRTVTIPIKTTKDFVLELAPLSLAEQQDVWQPLDALAARELVFENVTLGDVTAFVSVRARNQSPPMERTRVVLARLHMSAADLDRRDEIARQHLLADADPAAVLLALIRGLAHLRSGDGSRGSGGTRGGHTVQQLLADTSLERVLQAVAEDRTIVSDLRILVGPSGDAAFQLFCNELDEACKAIDAECNA
jgi:hypothetical protein